MLKKLISCIMTASMSLSIISSSTFGLPHFNPATTDFTSPISGERNSEQAVPGCTTCVNYIFRYEFVDQLVQMMNALISEANNNKEKNLYELKSYQKVRDLLGTVLTVGSEKIIEKVLQNVFDSLKQQTAGNELALNISQATIGATIGALSISALKAGAVSAAATSTTGAIATTATTTAAASTTAAAAGTVATTAATTAAASTTAATAGTVATTVATATTGTASTFTTAAAAKAAAAMPYVGAVGGSLLLALSMGLIGYSYYINNENNKERIKINNYTSALGNLYSKLLAEDWKGNNVLVMAFDHGKGTPGSYIEFYKVNGIDYDNVNFGSKFNIALNKLEMLLQKNIINNVNSDLPSSQLYQDDSFTKK